MQETTFANYLAVTGVGCSRMICCMRLPFALAWLVDAAGAVHSADHFLASLGAQLIADGLPVAGGALTLTAPHPIIARRTWLWQAETGGVIEALGFGPLGPAGPGQGYVGRRSAAQVLAGRLRRDTGETIRAVLLYGDLRGFTALSEAMAPEAVITALDAWFDRIAGAVHAFGGEVLKFIGDGVLAIFPIDERPPSVACDAALRAVGAARAGMAHLGQARDRQGLPSLPFG